MLLAALVTLAGSVLQSATGFGFALVLGPVLFAVLEPAEALTTLLVLGACLNFLMLIEGPRPREIHWRQLILLLAGAVPGLVIGALILRSLPKPLLQVLVGLGVLAAALIQAREQREAKAGTNTHEVTGVAAGVGLVAGTLTTTTSTNGPPMVLWFQRIGMTPRQLRASITAAFLPLNLLGAVVLTLLAGVEQSLDVETVALLLVVTAVGGVAGRRIFERLDPRRFRAVGLALVVLAGIASIAAGISA